jgi:hypothetical protein
MTMQAIQEIKSEWTKEAMADVKAKMESLDPSKPFKPVVRTVTGLEAEAIADKPHLTGDPEWDAIELEETDPNKKLLDKSRFI